MNQSDSKENKFRKSIIARLRPPAGVMSDVSEQAGPMPPVEDEEPSDDSVPPPEDIDSIINSIPSVPKNKKKRLNREIE